MNANAAAETSPRVEVERWPTEIPLYLLVILAALGIWALLAFSILGIVYALILLVFFFVTHVVLITYIRGSAVRLGPDQFPELHQRVVELAHKAGITDVPAAYLMESGGSLNAFATRLFRSRLIVLYSDLLEACEDNESARDMVIGHELGHIRAGHLNWLWLLTPGLFVPFLGSAYSRAREFTCDRYGAALCGDKAGAATGLSILAAGRQHGPKVNLQAFADQTKDLDTGWLTLGKWLSGYPPLCDRVAAIEPSLSANRSVSTRGPVRAILILASIVFVPALLGVLFAAVILPRFTAAMESFAELAETDSYEPTPFSGDVEAAQEQVQADFAVFGEITRAHYETEGTLPEDSDELYELFEEAYPDQSAPKDPFDGYHYGYFADDDGFHIWSVGPDGEGGTEDDISEMFAVAPE